MTLREQKVSGRAGALDIFCSPSADGHDRDHDGGHNHDRDRDHEHAPRRR
ncbi:MULTISPECIES: hypothetical protein [unclassified Curtobacterium]|nr:MULTISPECIES: hypothetical protein [unclassified Curtobacterium]